jgi:hypothetical protein
MKSGLDATPLFLQVDMLSKHIATHRPYLRVSSKQIERTPWKMVDLKHQLLMLQLVG